METREEQGYVGTNRRSTKRVPISEYGNKARTEKAREASLKQIREQLKEV